MKITQDFSGLSLCYLARTLGDEIETEDTPDHRRILNPELKAL